MRQAAANSDFNERSRAVSRGLGPMRMLYIISATSGVIAVMLAVEIAFPPFPTFFIERWSFPDFFVIWLYCGLLFPVHGLYCASTERALHALWLYAICLHHYPLSVIPRVRVCRQMHGWMK